MIGRKEEKRMLQSLIKEEESQFVAVYGRRRIGKTYLVRESFHYDFTFQHTGISNASSKTNQENRRSWINSGSLLQKPVWNFLSH